MGYSVSDVVPITIALGDGIGPEIMNAVLCILKEAEAGVRIETIEVGEKLYRKKYTSGIAADTWESLSRTKVLLKAPITTPQGGGYKSLNVTLRKSLGLFANVRPSIAYCPFINTMHPNLDLTIIRENEEDLYAGIEYRHTHNVYESLKLISRTGSEKIIRFAFDYALKNARKKVTCFSKDNIMKFSDGIFHKVFDEIAKDYPSIESEHYIVDIGAARLAAKPHLFDIIVTSNLYGDIISDIAAEISGSVGLAGSANIGADYAMFEAVHGSAPDIADQDIANPSGLLNAAIMMLVHIKQPKVASYIENAWKKTLEDGIHTADIYNSKISSKKVGTKEFTSEVIKRLGQRPNRLSVACYADHILSNDNSVKDCIIDTKAVKSLIGVDVFININEKCAHNIADKLFNVKLSKLELKAISSKGLKLWPRDDKFELESDHWCCRFMVRKEDAKIMHGDIIELLKELEKFSIDFVKVENLSTFGGQKGFSLLQGE